MPRGAAASHRYNRTMSKVAAIILTLSAGLRAEVHTMTLRQAVALAVRQNPDIGLPRLVVGSGLAYTNGFPMSIEGSAPSIVQARASQYLFNRPQNYAIAQAKENVRGAAMDVAAK